MGTMISEPLQSLALQLGPPISQGRTGHKVLFGLVTPEAAAAAPAMHPPTTNAFLIPRWANSPFVSWAKMGISRGVDIFYLPSASLVLDALSGLQSSDKRKDGSIMRRRSCRDSCPRGTACSQFGTGIGPYWTSRGTILRGGSSKLYGWKNGM